MPRRKIINSDGDGQASSALQQVAASSEPHSDGEGYSSSDARMPIVPSSETYSDGDGLSTVVAHESNATSSETYLNGKGLPVRDAQVHAVLPVEDHLGDSPMEIAPQTPPANSEVANLCIALQELQVRRRFCIKQTTRLGNASGALLRRMLGWRVDLPEKERADIAKRAAKLRADIARGILTDPVAEVLADDVAAFDSAMEPADARRHEIELAMKRIVRKLPCFAWCRDPARLGFGELGLAVIIGEAGNLSKYPNPAKLWKRLGLAPISKGDETKAAGTWRREGGLTAEDWTSAGYNPARRAEIFAVVGDPLLRCQTTRGGPYREAYDKRRARTAETHPDWRPIRSHMDGLRIMTKQLVLDLWIEWRRAGGELIPVDMVPAVNLSGDKPERPADDSVSPKIVLSDALIPA